MSFKMVALKVAFRFYQGKGLMRFDLAEIKCSREINFSELRADDLTRLADVTFIGFI